MLIWCAVMSGAVSSCTRGLNAFNTVMAAFMACVGFFILREAAISLFGRTEIRIRTGEAELVEGFGPFSRRTLFDPSSVTAVTEYIADEQAGRRYVQLESSSPIYFGVRWSDQRRLAVIQSLQPALRAPYSEPLAVDERERRASVAAAESATVLGPSGTWVIADGSALRLGARCWTWAVIPFAVFACFWNGAIVTMAVPEVRAGRYWVLIFFAVFAAFGLFLTYNVLYVLLGRVEVMISGDTGTVFSGIGRFGGTQTFRPSQVTGIRQHYQRGSKGGTITSLVIEAGDDVMLGGTLTDSRREWLRSALAARLLAAHATISPMP